MPGERRNQRGESGLGVRLRCRGVCGPAPDAESRAAPFSSYPEVMSTRRRNCPECRREIAVVAGRFARHDPPGARDSGELVSCPGSRRQAELGAAQPALDGYVVAEFPGQLPLF